MNCVICNKPLEPVFEDSKYQPHDGGEIQLIFSYGSTQFDEAPGCTRFHGVICDDCAKPLTEKMNKTLIGWEGERLELEDEDEQSWFSKTFDFFSVMLFITFASGCIAFAIRAIYHDPSVLLFPLMCVSLFVGLLATAACIAWGAVVFFDWFHDARYRRS
jgi:hypothetical protein